MNNKSNFYIFSVIVYLVHFLLRWRLVVQAYLWASLPEELEDLDAVVDDRGHLVALQVQALQARQAGDWLHTREVADAVGRLEK